MKLIPKDFVATYLPYAMETQAVTGISAAAILAQAALESGWGEHAVGNMFFGIKDTAKGATGNGQLVVTTEYLKSPDMKHIFPEVLSVTWHEGKKKWKYVVRDWFRKYDSPAGSFLDHSKFFLENQRYATAVANGSDPVRFFEEVQKAGYATAPDYAKVLIQLVKMIQRHIPSEFESAAMPSEADFFEMPGGEELRDYLPERG